MLDSAEIKLGTGDEFKIYHDGTDSYVDNQTGEEYYAQVVLVMMYLSEQWMMYALNPCRGANGVRVKGGGAVELYHNNLK